MRLLSLQIELEKAKTEFATAESRWLEAVAEKRQAKSRCDPSLQLKPEQRSYTSYARTCYSWLYKSKRSWASREYKVSFACLLACLLACTFCPSCALSRCPLQKSEPWYRGRYHGPLSSEARNHAQTRAIVPNCALFPSTTLLRMPLLETGMAHGLQPSFRLMMFLKACTVQQPSMFM